MTNAIFTGTLGYIGDTLIAEQDGFTLTATVHYDDTGCGAPWDGDDGHGPVSDWTSRDKAPGEIVLSTGRRSKRFYDFSEACRIARRDGWACADGRRDGETARQYAARAAMEDFKRLKAWCDDEWHYVGVAVTVSRNDIQLTHDYSHALWGIESDSGDYLTEVANDLAPEALSEAQAALETLTA